MIQYDPGPFTAGFDAGFGPAPITRLGLHGTPFGPYGSFDGKVEQIIIPPAVDEKRGGAGGYRRHGRKSWWVLVGDERHKVTSKAEEQALVSQYIQTKEQELAVALAGTETTKAKGIRISLTRAIQRMERVKAEVEKERIKRLMDDDEEILFILSLH